MIEIVENSNLLDIEKGIICHQTNCVGAMGAGIALQIRNRWPIVFEKYKNYCKSFGTNPYSILGNVQDILVKDNLVIANCFGQVYYGRGLMTSDKAWDLILDKLKNLRNFYDLDLHFPWMIGCGLAGGDWSIMLNKIGNAFSAQTSKVYIHKLN